MDETSVFFDMPKSTTVNTKGGKTITIKTTGHEKDHVTVVLAAKGDGNKLKPYIVFKKAIREVKAMQNLDRAFVVSNSKGWMDDDLTKDWLDKVVVKQPYFSENKTRLLVWDSFRCHISKSTKEHLVDFKMKTAVIPGGCTKYIQAPDVSWNRPFKAFIEDKYKEWMEDEENMTYTKGGNLKAPTRAIIVEWVINAWNSLADDVILNSFKVCGLTVNPNGEEDNLIHCIKIDQPCRGAWKMLLDYRDDNGEREITLAEDQEDNDDLFLVSESDEEN